LTREDPSFENGFRTSAEGVAFARVEIRLESRKQAFDPGERRQQILRDLLPGEVPEYSPQFVVFVEADPVIDGVQFVRILLEEYMTALSIRVVAKYVKQHDGPQELLVFLGEGEVMIFGVVLDHLLERPCPEGTVRAQGGERNDVKAKMLTHQVCGNFTSRQSVFREIPERLLAAGGLIDSMIFPACMADRDKERIIRAKRKLARDFVIAVLESGL